MHIHDRRRWSRRRLLQGLGAGAALLPFVPTMRSEAAEDDPPRRLVLMFSSNGTLHEAWKPTGSEASFTLGEILEPLSPFQDRVNVLDGLRLQWGGQAGQHFLGMAGLWTGSAMGADGWADGQSVDQYVATQRDDPTPFSSLELGVQTSGANAGTKRHMCYAGPSQPLPSEDDPTAVFDRLFSGLDAEPDAAAVERRARRQSVIDLVRTDLHRLESLYGAEDRIKLEAHLESIRGIEQRLDLEVSAQCEPPASVAVASEDPSAFPEVLRLQADLLVAALACDLTRVASLQCSYAQSFMVPTWLGLGERHHAISHLDHSSTAVQQQVITINRWYAEQMAYLIERLDAVPEASGTLLDQSLVVWGNEMAKGQGHTPWPCPFVTAGSAGGAVVTGRSFDFGDTPHARLLVTICRAMGLAGVESFGTLDPGTGALPGMLV